MAEIDDSLYSRQRPVFGDGAMKKMADSRMFIYGLGGVGIEIAKNLVLCGIKELMLLDQQRCNETDLGSQFFIHQSDIDEGRTRAEASLPRLSALNPYVRVTLAQGDLSTIADQHMAGTSSTKTLEAFSSVFSSLQEKINDVQCLIVTQGSLHTCSTLNVFCRLYNIRFIYVNTFGVLGNLFCDFGQDFVVNNPNGESPKEFFVGNIKTNSAKQLLVKEFNNQRHQLEDGDWIKLTQVAGMTQVNDRPFPVTVHSPSELLLTVDFPIEECGVYSGGGIATQVVHPTTYTFEPLLTQLRRPSIVTCDLSCPEEGPMLHLIFLTLKKFEREEGRLPKPWCRDDWELCKLKLAVLYSLMSDQNISLDEALAYRLVSVAQGQLAPLCAFFGGVAAQEAIKAVTGVFMPYRQWLYLQYDAVVPRSFDLPNGFDLSSSRYDGLKICVGPESCARLQQTSTFMVGCGAIGCELLKNLALLGLATGDNDVSACSTGHADQETEELKGIGRSGVRMPCLFVTDNDHIEKSNLNRQFLFRAHHIGRPKSIVAAQMAREINPAMNIHPMQEKLWSANEKTVFTDSFLTRATSSRDQTAAAPVLAALDCVASRKYLDHRCVSLGLPLIESGTLGTKGHVQVVVPHQTESYNSQQDDEADDEADSIPYCTLKSFPIKPVHCIEWAREKFTSQFTLKPGNLSRLLAEARAPTARCGGDCPQNTSSTISSLCRLMPPSLAHFLLSRPTNWKACVRLARDKFERYFNHKARVLLHAFPPETKLVDGTPFWQLPKRKPTPLHFDVADKSHRQFVLTFARLLADQLDLSAPDFNAEDDRQCEYVTTCLDGYEAPAFVPSHKRIVTEDGNSTVLEKHNGTSNNRSEKISDTDSTKSASAAELSTANDVTSEISVALTDPDTFRAISACHSIAFEKDDDTLAHIDFITAAANLRATMYDLSSTPRHEVRRIAGRIVPAIATTTAAIAGLVCLELVKCLTTNTTSGTGMPFRNAFLNLALPLVLLSEPAAYPTARLPNGTTYNLWDRWLVKAMPGRIDQYKLADFIDEINKLHNLVVAVVNQDNRMVYASYLPVHKSRKQKPLVSLLNYMPDDEHVDLMVAYDAEDADLVQGPPVRFLLK